jgi:hypothetical protein
MKIDEKKLRKMAREEPVDTFIGFSLKRIGIEQYEKWMKEDGLMLATSKLRTVAWYYKLRVSGYDLEDAKVISKCMVSNELIISLMARLHEEKKGE